jgi:hypothetical protein
MDGLGANPKVHQGSNGAATKIVHILDFGFSIVSEAPPSTPGYGDELPKVESP